MRLPRSLTLVILLLIVISFLLGCSLSYRDEEMLTIHNKLSGAKEFQIKQIAEKELIKDLGQEYFARHYYYLRTEEVSFTNGILIGYTVRYNYTYEIENFEPIEMEFRLIKSQENEGYEYNTMDILDQPLKINYLAEDAEKDCFNAFLNGSLPEFFTDQKAYREEIRYILWSQSILLIMKEGIGPYHLYCEFDAATGALLRREIYNYSVNR